MQELQEAKSKFPLPALMWQRNSKQFQVKPANSAEGGNDNPGISAGISTKKERQQIMAKTHIFKIKAFTLQTAVTKTTPLTPDDLKLLAQCEDDISMGIQAMENPPNDRKPVTGVFGSSLLVGESLFAIYLEELHRQNYHGFEDYCLREWGLDKSNMLKLMGLYSVVSQALGIYLKVQQ
jgi:hypothetical protein